MFFSKPESRPTADELLKHDFIKIIEKFDFKSHFEQKLKIAEDNVNMITDDSYMDSTDFDNELDYNLIEM